MSEVSTIVTRRKIYHLERDPVPWRMLNVLRSFTPDHRASCRLRSDRELVSWAAAFILGTNHSGENGGAA